MFSSLTFYHTGLCLIKPLRAQVWHCCCFNLLFTFPCCFSLEENGRLLVKKWKNINRCWQMLDTSGFFCCFQNRINEKLYNHESAQHEQNTYCIKRGSPLRNGLQTSHYTGLTNLRVVQENKMVKERNIYPTTKQPQSASTSPCAKKEVRDHLTPYTLYLLHWYGTCCGSDRLIEVRQGNEK